MGNERDIGAEKVDLNKSLLALVIPGWLVVLILYVAYLIIPRMQKRGSKLA